MPTVAFTEISAGTSIFKIEPNTKRVAAGVLPTGGAITGSYTVAPYAAIDASDANIVWIPAAGITVADGVSGSIEFDGPITAIRLVLAAGTAKVNIASLPG